MALWLGFEGQVGAQQAGEEKKGHPGGEMRYITNTKVQTHTDAVAGAYRVQQGYTAFLSLAKRKP